MYRPDIDPTKSPSVVSTPMVFGILVVVVCVFVLAIVAIVFLGKDSDDDTDDEIVVPEEIKDIVDLRDTNKYANDSEDLAEYIQEVREIGWFSLNKEQHQYEIDNIDYDKEDEKILDADDIFEISKMFKSMFDYAVALSYKEYGKGKKDERRKNREEFKNILIELMNKCEPYGKTYNEFNECIEPYLIELNNLGPNFETNTYKWKVLFGKWSFTVKDTAGDINLDYMLRDKIRSVHFVDTLPISSYAKDSPEVTLLGWLAYNDAQHSYMMRKANVNEDEDEDEDMLTLEDIKIIANFFLELWRSAVDQSFKRSGSRKTKERKRENREKYLDKIEELQDTCSPYGKTYIEFGTCIQSRMLELENLGKETGKDILYGESLDNEIIDKLYN